MNAQERRAAVLREIEIDSEQWITPSGLQSAAWHEVGGDDWKAAGYWDRRRAWTEERGNSESSFRRTAAELFAEGILERRNLLSGSHARFQYRKVLQPVLLD